MNSVVPWTIPGHHHDLISDPVTLNVRDLFIQVHRGSWCEAPCYGAPPPSIATLPPCHARTQPGDRVIDDRACGAIDDFWRLYTKATTLVTLAAIWQHSCVRCLPENTANVRQTDVCRPSTSASSSALSTCIKISLFQLFLCFLALREAFGWPPHGTRSGILLHYHHRLSMLFLASTDFISALPPSMYIFSVNCVSS